MTTITPTVYSASGTTQGFTVTLEWVGIPPTGSGQNKAYSPSPMVAKLTFSGGFAESWFFGWWRDATGTTVVRGGGASGTVYITNIPRSKSTSLRLQIDLRNSGHPVYIDLPVSFVVYGQFGVNQAEMDMALDETVFDDIKTGMYLTFNAAISSGAQARWLTNDRYSWVWTVVRNNISKTLDDAITDGWVELNSSSFSVTASYIRLRFVKDGTYSVNVSVDGASVANTAAYNTTWDLISKTDTTENFLVIGQLTPGIIVYSYHDSHNQQTLDGHPPWTVTFKDTSTNDQSESFPIVLRQWDFGDPDSGCLNSYALFGELDPTAPDYQDKLKITHNFVGNSGYGPYNVTLTITNTVGAQASTTYQFKPNTVVRVTETSDPTPLSGVAPLLLTCEVETAGYPIPETTWSYVLQDDPGYYSGSKIGDFAELSLLAAGTYTITRTVTQEEQESLVQTWTAIVSAPPVIADTPVQMGELLVWQYNTAGTQRLALLDVVNTPRIQWNFNTAKVFTFRIPTDYSGLPSLRIGTLLAVGFAGKARPFVIASRTDTENADWTEFECVDYAGALFDARVALIATNSTTDNGYDVQTCSGEALMRYWARANLNTGRTDPFFNVTGTNSDLDGETVTYSARYKPVLDIMKDLCTASGLGWDVAVIDPTLFKVGWKPVLGADHTVTTGTNPVILSARLMTASVEEYAEDLSPTVAIGAGAGEGAFRTYTAYNIAGTPNPSLSGLDRREVFCDAGDAADASEVKRMAVSELKTAQNQTIYAKPDTGSPYVFGTDYFVGDMVTIEVPQVGKFDLRVLAADYAETDTGTVLELKLGTDRENYAKMISKVAASNSYARK